MTTEFFTRPKHDFTRLGRVDGWLGRTLIFPKKNKLFGKIYDANIYLCFLTNLSMLTLK